MPPKPTSLAYFLETPPAQWTRAANRWLTRPGNEALWNRVTLHYMVRRDPGIADVFQVARENAKSQRVA